MTPNLITRLAAAFALSLCTAGPLLAQVTAVDPNTALSKGDTSSVKPLPSVGPVDQAPSNDAALQADLGPRDTVVTDKVGTTTAPIPTAQGTYRKDDVIGAAEGVFGKGAKGLAELIEKVLKDQGEPNAYIAGREASGAFVVGLRYGSGTLTHTVEGTRPVYWTGPSIGFDVGGDATKTFVLVYNLYDSQDLYKRYPQVEGRAYFVGGFSATYLRRGSVAIIPVRLGVGVRLGANIGYMKFSEKSKWLPF
jgi:hypothetical protein